MPLTGSVLKSERFVIAAGCGERERNLFQVQFSSRDGSVRVCFPYFPHTHGLVSKATIPAGPRQADLALQVGGKVSSHLVKYSHHPDGTVLFSQTGRVLSSVRKQGVPLSVIEGHVFTLHAQGLLEFAEATPKDLRNAVPSPRRTRLVYRFEDSMPASVKFVGRLHSLEAVAEMAPDGVIQPKGHAMDPDGKVTATFVCAPPDHFPGPDRLLLLSCEPLGALDRERAASIVFLGGFDPPAIVNDLTVPSSVPAFSYPVASAEELRERLGSIDFQDSTSLKAP
ncbi:MAG: hypothetical protein AB7O37_00025 [Vicinamibacteria bacterium]